MKLPNIIPLRQKVEAALGNAIGHIPGLSWNTHPSERDTLKVTGDANAAHVRAWLEWKGRVPVPVGTETATVRLTLKFDLVNSGGSIGVSNYSLKHTYVSVSGIQGAIADILNIDDREVKKMLRKIDLGQGFKGLNIPLGVGTVRPTRVSFFPNGDVSLSWPDNVATLVAMVNNELVPGSVDCDAIEAGRNRDRSTALAPPAQFLNGPSIWKDFYGSWEGNRKKNTHRLLDFEPYREGNRGDFEGVWRKGKADTHLSFTDGWKSFYEMYKARKGKGLRLVDFETYAVGNKRRYVGLWRKGTPDTHLWYTTGWTRFFEKWKELGAKGYRLSDFEAYSAGNKKRFIGLWRRGAKDSTFWFTTGWNSFLAKWKELRKKNLKLVDFETYRIGDKRRFIGLWRKGKPDSHLWYVTGSISFYSKWQELFEKGYQLVEFESYRVGNQRRYIGLCRAAKDGL